MNLELIVITGIGTMFLLVISLLLAFNTSQRKKFQYQQNLSHLKQEQQNELIKAAVISEEGERHRISEELHDEVGALLSATKLYMSSLHTINEKEQQLHIRSLELLDDSIGKVRSISHNLHSGILKELGLNEAINSFFHKLGQADKLDVHAHLDATYEDKNIEKDISIYRMIQEISNNIIKHTHASSLTIQSKVKNNTLEFIISHNGKGLTQEEFERLRYEGKGLGLKNIQNRIILLKGKIYFTSAENNSQTILTVPLNNEV